MKYLLLVIVVLIASACCEETTIEVYNQVKDLKTGKVYSLAKKTSAESTGNVVLHGEYNIGTKIIVSNSLECTGISLLDQ